jgi:hypothetical protein
MMMMMLSHIWVFNGTQDFRAALKFSKMTYAVDALQPFELLA